MSKLHFLGMHFHWKEERLLQSVWEYKNWSSTSFVNVESLS